MMIKLTAAITIVTSLSFSAVSFAADSSIKLTNTITDQAYTLSTVSDNQNTSLGKVNRKAFSRSNAASAITRFTIAFESSPTAIKND